MNNPNNREYPGDEQQPGQHTGKPDSQQLMQKHLADEHHEITDEDLRNVRISTDHINFEERPAQEDDDTSSSDNDDGTDPNHPIVMPWDVVG